ncbi:amidohydrolase [Nonomuraea sp. KC401]|uniref:amidohydrolase family protein n=1 Tax=unclassified Nonomuraea TaxID=2593643 RepID=UPI0010FE8BB3|nr:MULTISPECIES: amidohydrolase family protein [unclassified Nonomuraea]NBE91788.1 amidohydrolase family protein [Nonomuraea sp. K271]TLF86388.1 amidohydrolase [Nonomuraea sp. KC401]
MTLIDAHAHLVTDDPAYPFDPPGGTVSEAVRNDPMTAERLLAALREHGLSGAIAVQRAHVYGYDNSYVVDSAARYPDRLAAMCVLDARAPDAAERVRHWARRGAVAVRLTSPGGNQHGGTPGTEWFAGAEARRVWRQASELGLSMCLHIYRWNRDESLRALAAVTREFPGTPVVVDHIASVETDRAAPYPGADGLLALADRPQVLVKVTTLNLARIVAAGIKPSVVVEWLVSRFGAERVLWGSDVTQTPGAYADMVRIARESVSGLSDRDAALVLGGTSASLYRVGTP